MERKLNTKMDSTWFIFVMLWEIMIKIDAYVEEEEIKKLTSCSAFYNLCVRRNKQLRMVRLIYKFIKWK
jgi:hypothetical protein